MNTKTTTEIKDLAYHIWRSSGEDYSRAVDFWLMAEQMVLELMASSARMARGAVEAATVMGSQSPKVRAAYAEEVAKLAQAMYHSAGEQMGSAFDFWVSAERHVRALSERTARSAGAAVGVEDTVGQVFETFTPDAYLEEIRKIAYHLWESAEHQYDTALEYWLAAERQYLEMRIAMIPVVDPAKHKKWSAGATADAVSSAPRKRAAAPVAAVAEGKPRSAAGANGAKAAPRRTRSATPRRRSAPASAKSRSDNGAPKDS